MTLIRKWIGWASVVLMIIGLVVLAFGATLAWCLILIVSYAMARFGDPPKHGRGHAH